MSLLDEEVVGPAKTGVEEERAKSGMPQVSLDLLRFEARNAVVANRWFRLPYAVH